MTIPTLETNRLILRPWIEDDAGALFQILQEPGILQYFPPTTFTLEKTLRYINHQTKHWLDHGYGHWAVTLKESEGVIGWDGLEYLPETDENEVAYLLSHQAWGCGYATEAAAAAVKFGFEKAGLKSIIGLVHPGNAGSIRVLEKCGLEFVDRKVYWGSEMCRYRIRSTLAAHARVEHKQIPALKAGATSYILKDMKMEKLVDTLRRAVQGEVTLHPRVAARVLQNICGENPEAEPLFTDLTKRELEVLKLIASGLTNSQIADKLVISENTVKGHVSNILSKLHVADRTQVAVYAWQRGIVQRDQ